MCANYRPPGRRTLEKVAPFRWRDERLYAEEAYPGSPAPFLRMVHDGEAEWAVGVFGLVPSWASDLKFSRRTYNAHRERCVETQLPQRLAPGAVLPGADGRVL
jgi:putative SOS response-associated peptidase YedK